MEGSEVNENMEGREWSEGREGRKENEGWKANTKDSLGTHMRVEIYTDAFFFNANKVEIEKHTYC